MSAFAQINLPQFAVRSRGKWSCLQQGNDSQISYFFLILISLILFVYLTMESSDSINEGKNDLQVLIEKQDTQFRALTEALKCSPNNLGFALENSVSKLSKSIDKKIDKLYSTHNSRQPEDLNRKRLETSSSYPNGKRRVGPAKLPGNPNKKRIISQDDDSLSLTPLDVEEELQQEDDPLRKVMFVVNDTEPQSEGHTDDILCELTEEFNNYEICDPKINTNLAKNKIKELASDALAVLSQSNQELLQQR